MYMGRKMWSVLIKIHRKNVDCIKENHHCKNLISKKTILGSIESTIILSSLKESHFEKIKAYAKECL